MTGSKEEIDRLLADATALENHIGRALEGYSSAGVFIPQNVLADPSASAVIFLLGDCPSNELAKDTGPCLILNKRSARVRQPGDLCCPGGSIAPRLDIPLAKLLRLPFWPRLRRLHRKGRQDGASATAFALALLLATGLRESFEEMRLNPLSVRYLGALPPERLVMFRRVIYPLVCRVPGQYRFHPNWEVAKVVYIPLRELLKPLNYARYRLKIDIAPARPQSVRDRDFPCFVHRSADSVERLWGATYRIAMTFLELVFGFRPPPAEQLEVVEGRLGRHYLKGGL
jgi:hypothetical protein